MEEFSQSRGDDDLFDDEIVPIEPTSTNPVENVTQKLEQTSVSPPSEARVPSAASQPPSQRGRGRGRGAASRDTPRPSRGLEDSKFAPKPPPPSTTADPTPPAEASNDEEPTYDLPTTAPLAQEDPTSAVPTAPTQKPRTPAVRGDRSRTGGSARPKLSEEALTAKLTAAKQRSVEKAAAHARAQADKESFDERERVARKRREEEEGRRKELEGEREQNRRRKMMGGGGREWDREKVEGFEQGTLAGGSRWEERARERRREGLIEGEGDLREYLWDEERGSRQGRGRGRGRGRGGRGGRGGFANGANGREVNVTAEQEFPALPAGRVPKESEEQRKQKGSDAKSKVAALPAGTGSWADQVEVEGADKGKW